MKPNTISLNLRLPAVLHKTLSREAKLNLRSLNSEIISRLANSLGVTANESNSTRPQSQINHGG